MKTTTILKAEQAGDFLAAVPALLGYQPSESAVIVPFRGHRTIGAMRLDLPDAEHAEGLARVATGMVCKLDGATGLALIVYGEREQAEPVGAAIATQTSVCGLDLIDALYVTEGGEGRVGGDGTLTPLGEVPAHIAALVAEADQQAGATLPEVDETLAAEIAAGIPADLTDADCGDMLDLFEGALTWDTAHLEAGSAAVLIAMLNRPALRDVALVQWSHSVAVGEIALDAQIAWENGVEYPKHLASIMWGEGPRPDADRLRAAVNVCRHLAALAPEAAQPGPLATAAWLSWALGRSTHADVYVRRALAISPEHGLSQIVASFVAAGHLPEWAFTR